VTRTRTLRGQLQNIGRRLLVVDDGRFNHGYRLKGFFAWPSVAGGPVDACLATSSGGATAQDAGNGLQIGWVMSNSGNLDTTAALIDPDHIIIEDLFIQSNVAAPTNYVIVLEMIEVSTNQAIASLIKERAQQ